MAADEKRAVRAYLQDLLKDATSARPLVDEARRMKPGTSKRAGPLGQEASLTHAQRMWLEGHVMVTHWKDLAADRKAAYLEAVRRKQDSTAGDAAKDVMSSGSNAIKRPSPAFQPLHSFIVGCVL